MWIHLITVVKEQLIIVSMSYHVPHQSQVNTQSSGLSPRTPSLLENPLTFFTNTCHPSQRYHLSFSTKKDCVFSHNTVVNIDVAPRLPVCHIITHLVRVGVNTSILILIVSILLYVLQASLIAYTIQQFELKQQIANSNSTMKFSLTSPDWTKVFKDNYHKYSVPTGAGADDTTTMKVLVFE
jgi:hypothetical protein